MSADTFDFVIVGAGSAGSVLANRLTEDGVTTVCVVEAGGWDRSSLIRVPAGFVKLNTHASLTWPFASEPTENTAGRSVRLPQGKVVGGSSSINGMVYNRGQREDFDDWSGQGNAGWSYAEVLPYFKRTERRTGLGSDTFRGRDGALPVTDNDWQDPVMDAFLEGLAGLGLQRNPDYNAGVQDGSGYFQRLIDKGRRVSAAHAFLHPAKRRPNLDIRTDTRVTKVLVEGRRAVGVEVIDERDKAGRRALMARREVILCSGALNTPKLLQLSGIGPAPLLQSLGIPTQLALPGVGEGLRDHYAVRMVAAAKEGLKTINERTRGVLLAAEIAKWLAGRPSLLAVTPSIVYAFARSPYSTSRPDLMFIFTPGSYMVGKVYQLDRYPGMTCGFGQQRPRSVGYVRAKSSDPFETPLVQPNYLADPFDGRVAVAGLRMVRRFLHTPSMAPFFERETLPGPEADDDDQLLAFAKAYGITSFHFCGTAKMGPASDPMAVVDSQLRVHGIAGLRVVDASVMPMIVSANTYAATLMIAEKAADLLRGTAPLPPVDLQSQSSKGTPLNAPRQNEAARIEKH